MTPDDHTLTSLVYSAIDEYNASAERPLEKSLGTVLYGEGSSLDSLGLVNLIIALEQLVLDRTGRALALATSRAFSPIRSPFRDVGTLIAYLRQRLSEAEP